MKNSNKVVVYTAIMGGFDKICDPKIITPNVDYICFTDNKNLKSNIWKIVTIEKNSDSPRKQAREIKIRPHKYLKGYKYSIWVDGNIDIIDDLSKVINEYFFVKKTKIYTFKHYLRNCVYEEALACINFEKDSVENVYLQIKKCIDNGYPSNAGLAETNVMFRKHCENDVVKAMEEWWLCVNENSIRDQLSFDYIIKENKMKYEFLNGNARGNSIYFKLREHGDINIVLKICKSIMLRLSVFLKNIANSKVFN